MGFRWSAEVWEYEGEYKLTIPGPRKGSSETDGEVRTAVECAEDAEEDGYAAGG